jgi:hypothetical protein
MQLVSSPDASAVVRVQFVHQDDTLIPPSAQMTNWSYRSVLK